MSSPRVNTSMLGKSRSGRPALVSGSFVLNGVGAVTDITGIITSVERLVDGGGYTFFRCTLDDAYPIPVPDALTANRGALLVHTNPPGNPAATQSRRHCVPKSAVPPSPIATIDVPFTHDIMVQNNGAPYEVAGAVVSLILQFDL